MAFSRNFPDTELKCHCGCNVNHCNQKLVDALEELRLMVGPVTVTSGYRCGPHNAKVGGEPNSQHRIGTAADVKVSGMSPAEVYQAARKIPAFRGFGVASTFVHLDVRESPAKWCYGADGKQCPWDAKLDGEVLA